MIFLWQSLLFHVGIVDACDRVIGGVCDSVCVCLCVRALKGERLELSTSGLVHVYSMAVVRYALTQRS